MQSYLLRVNSFRENPQVLSTFFVIQTIANGVAQIIRLGRTNEHWCWRDAQWAYLAAYPDRLAGGAPAGGSSMMLPTSTENIMSEAITPSTLR